MDFWVRRLFSQLTQHPLIDRLRLRRNRISVKYVTGFKKNYVFGPLLRRHYYRTKITRAEGTITEPIQVGYQYQWRLLKRPDLEPYFLVKRERIKRSSYLEQELLVHDILSRLQKIRLIKCHYSPTDLQEDIDRIKSINHAFFNGVITLYPNCGLSAGKPRPGHAWVETYFDCDSIRRSPDDDRATIEFAFTCDKLLYVAIQKVVKTTKWDVTISSIRKMLCRLGYGPVYRNPVTYKIIFKQLLRPAGRIISDLRPHLGTKALAAAVLGAKYNPMGEFPIEMANDLGLELADPGPHHDILLLDNNFERVDIDEAMKWRSKCREMLLFVKHDQMEEARLKYKPDRIVKIKTKLVTPRIFTPDYLFHFY